MLLRRVSVTIPKLVKRNYGITAPVLQKVNDPIQQLFIDKIREYKSKGASSPELQKQMKVEHEKIAKQYGGGEGVDMTAFPKFKFSEPKIDTGLPLRQEE